MKVPGDIDLLAALMRDDEVAFAMLYKRYHSSLFEVCMKYLKNEDTAHDVVQSVFLWVWENRKDLTIDTNVRSYLCTTTKNKILNLLRHENLALQNDYVYAQERLSDQSWLEKMRHEGQLTHLRELIGQLPEQRRRICEMKINEGLSNQQIADLLGISIQTVKNQYSSSIKDLKEQINEKNKVFLRLG